MSGHIVAETHAGDARIEARPERGLRRYWLETEGFDGYEVVAASAGQAKWQSFASYDDVGYGRFPYGTTQSERFKRFLERTVCHARGLLSDGASTRQEHAAEDASGMNTK